jgi:AcrR family transcriptional regulator
MSLTRDQIVAAAIAIVDADGPDALSMRRLADALGAGAASVYWHVPGKEALLELVADRVIGEAFDGLPPAPDWRRGGEQAARALRAAMRRHPGVGPVIARRPPTGPSASRAAAAHIGLFLEGGFDARSAVLASTTVMAWATMSGVLGVVDDARAPVVALPADLGPGAAAIAAGVDGLTADDAFEYGLAAILDGIEAGRRRAPDPRG